MDTCGIYAILNAWMYILDLPALHGTARLVLDAEGGMHDEKGIPPMRDS